MIADSRIDHDRRRITLVVGPTLDVDELTAVISEHANLGVWHYDVLFDQRASSTVFSSDAVRTLVAHVQSLSRRHGRRGRLAIVPDDDAQYGMARMYSMLAENAHEGCQVFRSFTNAEAWLDQRA